MASLGITGFGAYVPRLRIERSLIAHAHKWMAPSLAGQARGSRAFASWDEDSVTMAVEAVRDALHAGETKRFDALRLATTTAPYADNQASAQVASALRLGAKTASSDAGNSQRAGTSILLQALRSRENSIVVAADAPRAMPASLQELSFGAGAAAFTIGSEDIVAKLLGSATITDNFVDHFRPTGEAHDYNWEERWVRDEGYGKIVPEAVAEALADASISLDAIDCFVLAGPLRGIAGNIAKKLKFAGKVADDLQGEVGYCGTAHSLLMLAHVLEEAEPGQKILVVGFGQGADALILETSDRIAAFTPRRGVRAGVADAIMTDSYLRMLSFAGEIEFEWGMRAEKNAKTALTEQYRSSEQIDGFVAGRCGDCDVVQFPQLQYCVNCRAPSSRFSPVPLADESATVLTSTADWLSYHPSPPLHVGFVQFENGARLLMEMVDVDRMGIEPGEPLRMVYRIKERDRQRGYNRYFWKSTPTSAT